MVLIKIVTRPNERKIQGTLSSVKINPLGKLLMQEKTVERNVEKIKKLFKEGVKYKLINLYITVFEYSLKKSC